MIAGSESGSRLAESTSDGSPTRQSHGTEETDVRKGLRFTSSELAALSPIARQILSEICLEIAKVRDSAEI